jgi:hypothetical protein
MFSTQLHHRHRAWLSLVLTLFWCGFLTAGLIVYPDPGGWVWSTGIVPQYVVILALLVGIVFTTEQCAAGFMTNIGIVAGMSGFLDLLGLVFGSLKPHDQTQPAPPMDMPLAATVWINGLGFSAALLIWFVYWIGVRCRNFYRDRRAALQSVRTIAIVVI